MNEIKKIWEYGSKEPIQRIGIIIFIFGVFSLFLWMIKENLNLIELFDYGNFPQKRDSIIFHLFIYFIPLGLIFSFGYNVLLKIKNWVLGNKPKEDDYLVFTKRSELTNYVIKKGFGEKRDRRYMCGYVSKVLSPEESRKEALELNLISELETHVLHVDVLLITNNGEELVFAPSNSLSADLKIGDFVLVGAIKNSTFSEASWHYTLDAKLRPIYNKKGDGWVIDQDYRV